MPLDLVALGLVEGVEVLAAPVAGVVWDRGTLLRLDAQGVAWSVPLAPAPALAVYGRRLYVGWGARLACLDLHTGGAAWDEPLAAEVRALAAHPDGVDVLTDDGVELWGAHGDHGDRVSSGRPGTALRRVGHVRYVSAADGVWRLTPGERPVLLYGCASPALFERAGTLHALADGPGGTVLVEDAGVPLVWPFPKAASHFVAPWGAAEWAVAPRVGRGGIWVIDRRLQTRWKVPLPGAARALAVAGRAVVAVVDDGGTALAIAVEELAAPLLLAIADAQGVAADGDRIYVTQTRRTTMYQLRES
jgi:hypothetical protein